VSAPDGNTVRIRFVRPDTDDVLAVRLLPPRRRHAERHRLRGDVPGVARVLAAEGVAVAMVDFRNCVTPSSADPRPSRSRRV
jgi:acetyl esterase